MSSKRKLEEKHLKIIKEIQKHECNKRCFECDQRGPTYIDVTIGSFVCTSCGGLLRGINPPHRIKSVSMATFTPTEIAHIETRGNEYCKNIYLGKYDERSKAKPESRSDHAKLKTFMEQKYEQKRWYIPPEEAQKPLASVTKNATEKKKSADIKPLSSLLGPNANVQITKTSPKQRVVAKQPVNNIFDLNSPTSTAPSSSGFADFNNAFTSSTSTTSFDAFGDFTSGQPQTSAPSASTNNSGFANFSNMIVPSSTTETSNQAPAVQQPAVAIPTQDKYADLGDLFNIESAPTDSSTSMWSSFPQSTSTSSNSIFGSPKSNPYQQANTQQSVFNSAGSSNPTSNSVFGNTQQTPSMFGNNVQQQPQQQATAYGNTQSQTPANQFGQFSNQNQLGFGQPSGHLQQKQQPFGTPNQQAFGGFSQQQTPFGANPQAQSAFPNQGNHNAFSNMQQTNFPNQQAYMGGQQSAMQPQNPFVQAQAQPQANVGNPFMTQQQQATQQSWNNQQTYGQPQSMATNPFTGGAAAMPAQKSTNPFF